MLRDSNYVSVCEGRDLVVMMVYLVSHMQLL